MIEALRPFTGGRDTLSPPDIHSVASDFNNVAVSTLRPSNTVTGDDSTLASDALITANPAHSNPAIAAAQAAVASNAPHRPSHQSYASIDALHPPTHLKTIGAESPSQSNTLMTVGIILGAILILGAGLFMILG